MNTLKTSCLCLAGWLLFSFQGSTQAANFVEINGRSAHPDRIVAKIRDNIEVRGVAAQSASLGLPIHHQLPSASRVVVIHPQALAPQSVDPRRGGERLQARIDQLKNTGLFEYVQPDYLLSASAVPNDRAYTDGTLWGLRNLGQFGGVGGADIDATHAWDITTGSTNVVVAVIDTGIRYTHQELAGQMWRNPGEIPGNGIDDDNDGYVDNVYGINAITGSGDPMDDAGHGSHVAGTIGAAANDGHEHVGIAWKVQLMACKFLGADGTGFTSDAIECINFAAKKGAKILNNSWGGGPFDQALFDAISAARDKGVLFVAAAGNDASDNDISPAYPASYQLDNIISVAALDRFDRLADFSNYGRMNVHIGAPGVEIFSCWFESDSDYNTIQGTSMAAPHVTGVAALLLARNPTFSAFQLRERILKKSVPIPSLLGKVSTGARLNAFRALQGEADGILEVSVIPAPGAFLAVGTNIPVYVAVSDDLEVTNATVVGTVGGSPITFINDGTGADQTAGDGIYTGMMPVPVSQGPFTLSLSITAPGKAALSTNVVYEAVLRPPNDNFASATKIPSGGAIVRGDNRLASLEFGEPAHAGLVTAAASLWWTWSASVNTSVIIDTAGSTFDTVVAIYTGDTLINLRPVAATNDLGLKKAGYVIFNATAAATYRIAVAGVDSNAVGQVQLRVELNGQPDTLPPVLHILQPVSGSLITTGDGRIAIFGTANDPLPNSSGVKEVKVRINNEIAVTAYGTTNWASTNLLQAGENTITVVAADNAENVSAPKSIFLIYHPLLAPNDLFANGTPLTGAEGTVREESSDATKEFNEPLHGGNEGGKSLWWTYTPTQDGVLLLSTEGSDFDTVLALYTGMFVDALARVTENDDAFNGSGFSEITVAVKGGVQYRIAVDGYAGSGGKVQLRYAFAPSTVFHLEASGTSGGTVQPPTGDYPLNASVTLTAVPDPFFQFAQFETIAGAALSKLNPYSIRIAGPTNIVARFTPRHFADDFETGDVSALPWDNNGWVAQSDQTFLGHYSAASTTHAKSSTNSLLLVTTLARGLASFQYRVSSEANFDRLEFYINDELLSSWSGEIPWSLYSFETAEGPTRLEWKYVKDSATDRGLDRVFLDNIDLPLIHPQVTLTAAFLAGNIQLEITGASNQTCTIQSSSDLSGWTEAGTVILKSDGKGTFSEAADNPQRFYRVLGH
jgi:subtilisin family serine protease